MRRAVPLVGLVLSCLCASSAQAAAPALVPVQGYLTDSLGTVINGNVELRFAIYADATVASPLWEETQSALAQDGFFTAYLGQVTALPLSLFRDHGPLWLGVQVDGDEEMPRALLGSLPYAAYAEYGAGGSAGIVIQGSATASYLLKIVNADTVAASALREEGGRLANLVDPVGPQDAATKQYVDSNAGGRPLSVYHSDGTTALGRYLDLNPEHVTGTAFTCDDLVYLNAQGAPVALTSRDCTVRSATWYFAGANCTGSVLDTTEGNDWSTNFNQKCRGMDWGGYYSSCYSASYRNNAGNCVNDGTVERQCAPSHTNCSQVTNRQCGPGACTVR